MIYNISETIPYVNSATAENTMVDPSGLCEDEASPFTCGVPQGYVLGLVFLCHYSLILSCSWWRGGPAAILVRLPKKDTHLGVRGGLLRPEPLAVG